ncbi:hypothetical protein FKM82_022914 [Ascaphus truei]
MGSHSPKTAALDGLTKTGARVSNKKLGSGRLNVFLLAELDSFPAWISATYKFNSFPRETVLRTFFDKDVTSGMKDITTYCSCKRLFLDKIPHLLQ